ncbi:MAG: hypothetical protein U0414_27550 [Polyangiaceae bacterium]
MRALGRSTTERSLPAAWETNATSPLGSSSTERGSRGGAIRRFTDASRASTIVSAAPNPLVTSRSSPRSAMPGSAASATSHRIGPSYAACPEP